MTAVTARLLSVLCAVLVVAGCSSGTNDQADQQTTTTTTTTTESSASLQPECRDMVDDAQALLTEVGKLATREATVEDVRTAADTLATSFDNAKTALGPEAQAQLDQAGQALQRIQDALGAQPVDAGELRGGASDLVAALGDAATVCSGNSTETSDTDTGTTTS